MSTTPTNPSSDPLEEILESLTFEVIKWNYGASSAECAAERSKAKAKINRLLVESRIDERQNIKGEILKYFRKELSGFRKELKNAQGLDNGEMQVVLMLLNRIDARYDVISLINRDRIKELTNQLNEEGEK